MKFCFRTKKENHPLYDLVCEKWEIPLYVDRVGWYIPFNGKFYQVIYSHRLNGSVMYKGFCYRNKKELYDRLRHEK